MDAAKIQALAYKGLGKGAKVLGTDHKVYRWATLLDPIAGPELMTIKASMTTSYGYGKAKKPGTPDMMLVADASLLQSWDWLVGEQTSYLCRLQPLLPPTVIQCNRVVSIVRPSYPDAQPGTEFRAIEIPIASALPVFIKTKDGRASSSKMLGFTSDTAAGINEYEVYVNASAVGSILKNDIVIDELGDRYEVDAANPSDFGYICAVRSMKP